MYRKFILWLFVFLLSAVTAAAQEMNDEESEAKALMATAQDLDKNQDKDKELSGMSIIGNDEAPKSLYIVPWKSSEIGAETSLDMMLNEGDVPVDREVLRRQLEFYQVSNSQ